ncbi:MAG: hypothetical protein OXI72_07195 [Gemmatimonadota bacterium]|nr:hypothetical protein [Gemmatimonadota bacterium]
MTVLTEAVVEDAALAWFESLVWKTSLGPDIAQAEVLSEGWAS